MAFGVIHFVLFRIVTGCFRNTSNLPNAMSACELDPVGRALRLGLSKLISLTLSLAEKARSYILYRNRFEDENFFIPLGTLLSYLALIPTFRAISLRILLYFKMGLVFSVALDLVGLFWGSKLATL